MSTPSLSHTYFGSTLTAGSALTEATNGGYAVLMQTTTLTTVATDTNVNSTITIPANSQIIDFFADMVTVPQFGTATKVDLTIGTAAAGTQYLSATDVTLVGRTTLAFTAAQLTAMSNVGNNTSVVATINPNGTIGATQGTFRVTVVYAMT